MMVKGTVHLSDYPFRAPASWRRIHSSIEAGGVGWDDTHVRDVATR
jgi:hypothetical protein